MGIPVFDIECVGWDNPIAVGFYDGYNYTEFMKENEEDDVIWRFLTHLKAHFRGIKLYAHCASKFDSKFILSSLCQHNEVVVPEAGFIRLRWKKPNITFEDSYLLLPMSLKNMNKMFGVEEKGRWPHAKNLRPWEMGDAFGTFRAYLKNDCLSLSHSIESLCEVLGYTFGITPSISLSTTSAKTFSRCFYDLDKVEANEEYESYIREAIFGGRNEVYKRYGEDINVYDVRSMYVSCYDTPVPTGKMRWIKPDIDKGALAEATVKIPKDWYIGPLPYKYKGRLIFPTGEVTNWWDTRELRNAAKLGVDITLRRQLYCEEEPILKEFGEFISKLRVGKQDTYWKMFGLALSGKLGQGRWKDVVKHISTLQGQDMEGYSPLDLEEVYFQRREYIGGRTPYIKPAIAMRIRSEARVRHLNLLLEASKSGEIFYGDTDSIFTTTSLPIGPKVGELTHLGKAERGYFIRQKLYAVIRKGKLTQRSAGYSDLRLSEEDFKSFLEGKEIETDLIAFPSYKELLKTKEMDLLKRRRSIRWDVGKDSRVPVGLDTKPICLPRF